MKEKNIFVKSTVKIFSTDTCFESGFKRNLGVSWKWLMTWVLLCFFFFLVQCILWRTVWVRKISRLKKFYLYVKYKRCYFRNVLFQCIQTRLLEKRLFFYLTSVWYPNNYCCYWPVLQWWLVRTSCPPSKKY